MRNIQRLTGQLAQAQVDGLLIINNEESAQPDTAYLSGFTGTTSWLFVTARGKRFLFVDARYHQRARREAKGTTLVAVPHGTPFTEVFLRHARQAGIRRIGFDTASTTVHMHERLWVALRPLELVGLPDIMRQLRTIKEAPEITLIARAAKITTQSFNQLLRRIKIGMTEIEVAKLLENLFFENGATAVAFPTIVASGVNGSQPHAAASTKKLRAGELVTIDCGAVYKGYAADFTRTIAVGSKEQLKAKLSHIHEAVKAAQQAGIASVRPAVEAQVIDTICRESLVKKGLDRYFTHGTGHGVGLEVHELPVLGPGQKTVLEPGMVVTVEPGVYIPGVGGVRIEDTLVVTKKGFLNLTKGISTQLIHIRR